MFCNIEKSEKKLVKNIGNNDEIKNNIFNFTLNIRNVQIPELLSIDEFYNSHTFSLNKDYG
jgi:hypothetical protein